MQRIKIFLLLILLFIIPSCKFFNQKPILEPTIEFKIMIMDENQNPINSFYELKQYDNISNTFNNIEQGHFESSYNIISDIQKNIVYQLDYWTETHYKKSELIKYPNSDYLAKLKFNKEDKKGEINVSFIGSFELDKENLIILNISVEDGSFKAKSICFDNSIRVIYTKPKNNYILCDSSWVNYSSYPHNNSIYYLPKDQYKCSDYIETCNDIEYNKCFVDQISVPVELLKNVTSCFKVNKIINDYFEYPILIKTMPFLNNDYIIVYLIDAENTIKQFTKNIG